MQEPTPEKGNLDELTRLTLRVISLETELGKLKQNFSDENFGLITEIRNLESRVKILEEARQAQRLLNDTFVRKELKSAEKPIKRFKWF